MAMDNIDRAMKEADRLGFGVSYGKYQAACRDGHVEALSSPPKPKAPEKSSGICRHCGKPFVRSHASKVYCSEECNSAAFRQRQRDYKRRKSKVPPVVMCATCGADFKPKTSRSKYCCKECAYDGRLKTAALWRAAQKKGAADGVSL